MSPLRFLLGEDFFISYSRADAMAYVAALANALSAKGFSCFIDQWGSKPGQMIPPSVLRSLDRSSMLLLVGSPAAMRSAAVELEVRRCLEQKRPIVPISIDGAMEAGAWFSAIAGASISAEDASALAAGQPSPAVLTRIENSFVFTRRNRRVRRSFVAAGLGLVALAGTAGWMTREANLAQARAADSARAAGVAERNAQQQQHVANEAKAEALQQQALANDAKLAAQAAQREAQAQRDLADQRLSIARSAELAAAARSQLAAEPDLAALLAVESYRAADTFEARRALLLMISDRPLLNAVLVGPGVARARAGGKADAGRITGLWFDDASSQLAVRDWDGAISLWSLHGPSYRERLLSQSRDLRETLPSLDLRFIAGIHRGDGSVRVRPLDGRGAEVVIDAADQELNALAMSPDGRMLASGSSDGVVTLWDSATGRALAPPLSQSNARGGDATLRVVYPITWLDFSADGRALRWRASNGQEGAANVPEGTPAPPLPTTLQGTVLLFSAGSTFLQRLGNGGLSEGSWYQGKIDGPIRTLIEGPLGRAVSVAAIDREGYLRIAGHSDGSITVFDRFVSRNPAAEFKAHAGTVTALAISADGRWIASGSDDRTIMLWRVRGASMPMLGPRELPRPSSMIQASALVWSRDGERLFYPSGDKVVVLDGHSGTLRGTPIDCVRSMLASLALAPDGRRLVAGGLGNELREVDPLASRCDDKPLYVRERRNMDGLVSLTFSPDGRQIVSGDIGGQLQRWNLATRRAEGEPLVAGNNEHSPLTSLAWLPQGLLVGSAQLERRQAWRSASPRGFDADSPRSNQVAMSPDGSLAAGSGPGVVTLWRSADGATLQSFTINQVGEDTASALAISADRRWLAIGQRGGRLTLVDLRANGMLGDLPLPAGCTPCDVRSLAFSPDARILAAIVDDRIARWPIDPERWIEQACHIANQRPFGRDEAAHYLGPARMNARTCGAVMDIAPAGVVRPGG